jgi:hypothetical protein
MAPMAGCVTDTDEQHFVFGFGFFKRFRTPGIPIDRIIGMLKQIRAAFIYKVVGKFSMLDLAILGIASHRKKQDHQK